MARSLSLDGKAVVEYMARCKRAVDCKTISKAVGFDAKAVLRHLYLIGVVDHVKSKDRKSVLKYKLKKGVTRCHIVSRYV